MLDSLRLMLFSRRPVSVFLLLGCALANAVAANPPIKKPALHPKPDTRPNIILITLDTTRADRMGFLGSKRGLTPNLDALAERGIVFTRAYSHVPITTASHATILTGTYPQFSHVNDFGIPLSSRLPYLPEPDSSQRTSCRICIRRRCP